MDDSFRFRPTERVEQTIWNSGLILDHFVSQWGRGLSGILGPYLSHWLPRLKRRPSMSTLQTIAEPTLASAGPWAGFGGHGKRWAWAYNGGLGAEPQRGPGAKPTVGSGAKPPRSWIPFVFCVSKGSHKFAPLLKKGKYNAAVLKPRAPRKRGALGEGPYLAHMPKADSGQSGKALNCKGYNVPKFNELWSRNGLKQDHHFNQFSVPVRCFDGSHRTRCKRQ